MGSFAPAETPQQSLSERLVPNRWDLAVLPCKRTVGKECEFSRDVPLSRGQPQDQNMAAIDRRNNVNSRDVKGVVQDQGNLIERVESSGLPPIYNSAVLFQRRRE